MNLQDLSAGFILQLPNHWLSLQLTCASVPSLPQGDFQDYLSHTMSQAHVLVWFSQHPSLCPVLVGPVTRPCEK